MLITMVPSMGTSIKAEEKSIESINNPRLFTKEGIREWDCVYFGNYPQSSDGKGNFKTEPIKWRVLSVNDNDAFLMSDKALDFKEFDTSGYDAHYTPSREAPTWETCTLRSWLNGYGSNSNVAKEDFKSSNFIDAAFTPEEKDAIYTSTVGCADSTYNPGSWNNTFDKVYLLGGLEKEVNYKIVGEPQTKPSIDWMIDHQFDTDYEGRCDATDFAVEKGCKREFTNWWYCEPGFNRGTAACIHGVYSKTDYDSMASKKAIRPVLHLNL